MGFWDGYLLGLVSFGVLIFINVITIAYLNKKFGQKDNDCAKEKEE